MIIKYYEVSLESIVNDLKINLEKIPNLIIAILFGSILRRKIVRDIDIAVYFKIRRKLKRNN